MKERKTPTTELYECEKNNPDNHDTDAKIAQSVNLVNYTGKLIY